MIVTIRPGLKWVIVTNALTYYDAEFVTAAKISIVHTQGLSANTSFMLNNLMAWLDVFLKSKKKGFKCQRWERIYSPK